VATPVGTVLSKKTFRVAGLHGTLSKLNGLEARAYEVPDTSGVAIPGQLRVPVNDKLSIELSSGQYLQELGWEFAWQQIMQKTAAQGASNNRACLKSTVDNIVKQVHAAAKTRHSQRLPSLRPGAESAQNFDVRGLFEEMDADGNGTLDKVEFYDGIHALGVQVNHA
jgi:hypothetical protein